MRVRELGNFGQHNGDDADVLNADPTVVQVVRKGLNVDQGHVVVREGAHISKDRKSLGEHFQKSTGEDVCLFSCARPTLSRFVPFFIVFRLSV